LEGSAAGFLMGENVGQDIMTSEKNARNKARETGHPNSL